MTLTKMQVHLMDMIIDVNHVKLYTTGNGLLTIVIILMNKKEIIATNPSAQINKNMHTKLWAILIRGCYSTGIEQIIGLNKPTYLEWLSNNFEGEITWATYGKVWQIDLVVPASAYDLTTEEGLLAAFNWKNIRPCLKKDNAAKYNFICHFTIANQSIRVLGFIRKMRQLKLEAFLNKFE